MLNDSNVISLQISTAGIMQQIVWIGSSSIRTVRTSVPVHGISGIRGVRVTGVIRMIPEKNRKYKGSIQGIQKLCLYGDPS